MTGIPAGASDAPAAPADAGAGFLAALIDQLLAGAVGGPTTTVASTQAAGTPFSSASVSSLLDPATPAGTSAEPTLAQLVSSLARQLKALKDQLEAGDTPDPAALKALGETADALAALLAQATPTAPSGPTAPNPPDPLAAIEPPTAVSQPTLPSTTATVPPPSAPSQPDAFFASLVDDTSEPETTASATPLPDPKAQPAAIADVATRLETLSQALAAVAPDVSRKLDTLSLKLEAVASSPQAIAQLDQDVAEAGTTLDTLIRSLLPKDVAPQSPLPAKPELAAGSISLSIPTVKSASVDTASSPTADATTDLPSPPKLSAPAASPTPGAPPAAAAPDDIVAKPKAEIADAAAAKSADASTQPVVPTAAQVAPRALPAAYQAAQNPINMGQLAFEMVRQVQQGQSRFTIRLDPPELGRVDVKLHVDAAGTVNAKLTVERAETLDMFQRDRSTLERALSQAGLESGKTNLEFSLRQNPFANMGGDQSQAGSRAAPRFAASTDDDAVAPVTTLYRGLASAGGVNLIV